MRAPTGKDPVTGKYGQTSRTFKGSKKAAEKALREFIAQVESGSAGARAATFGELIAEWQLTGWNNLETLTKHGYEKIIRLYLAPLMGRKLRTITTSDLDRLYAKLQTKRDEQEPLSPTSVHRVHALIHKAFNEAERWGWVQGNPARTVELPKIKKKRRQFPSADEVRKIVDACRLSSPDTAEAFLIAAHTGMRRGELTALRWSSVDLAAGEVEVLESAVKIPGKPIEIKSTKGDEIHKVSLGPGVIAAFVSRQERAKRTAAICGTTLKRDAFVFSNMPDGSECWEPDYLTNAWRYWRKKCGVEGARLHDLRHFSATRLLLLGEAITVVQARLGHAQATTTLANYSHYLPAADRGAAAAIDGVLAPQVPELES